MINKIIDTLNKYIANTSTEESKAEIQAQIKYLECMKNFSYVKEIENLKIRVETLQEVIVNRSLSSSSDYRVSRKDFIEIYDKVTEGWNKEIDNNIDNGPCENQIYGKDFTIHWNGIYCDCLDGCHPCNYLIPAIKDIDEDAEGFEIEF